MRLGGDAPNFVWITFKADNMGQFPSEFPAIGKVNTFRSTDRIYPC